MTNPLYTSLATSKLIASKMPSFETEHDVDRFWHELYPGKWELTTEYDNERSDTDVTPLNTHDCIRFIEEWGKNEGLVKVVCNDCGVPLKRDEFGILWQNCTCFERYEEIRTEKYHQHRFLDALIKDNLYLSGNQVDAFFESLLGKE